MPNTNQNLNTCRIDKIALVWAHLATKLPTPTLKYFMHNIINLFLPVLRYLSVVHLEVVVSK